jgi:hypothetical protein
MHIINVSSYGLASLIDLIPQFSCLILQLWKLGAKNILAGVGCGVGFGHGFGIGMPCVMSSEEAVSA